MKRAIVTPPTLAPAALAELKDWLGITISSEDAALTALLRMALESCEAFTGTVPLSCTCEEVLAIGSGWLRLAARPVTAITNVDGLDAAGNRIALTTTAYALDFSADGTGLVHVSDPGTASRIAVRFSAGLAPTWSALPDGLRHGIIRLAAHAWRQRESDGPASSPPAAVAAMWRPWRQMRLT